MTSNAGLPTFTPAGPVVQPTFAADAPESRSVIPPIVAIADYGFIISIVWAVNWSLVSYGVLSVGTPGARAAPDHAGSRCSIEFA